MARWRRYAAALATGRNPVWDARLPALSRRRQFHAIHSHDLPIALTGVRLARMLGARSIFDRHENWPGLMEGLGRAAHPGLKTSVLWATVNNPTRWRHWEREAIRRSDLVITVSPEAAVELPERPRATAVVSNYVSLATLPEPAPWPPQPPPLRLCFLGTLNEMFALQETVGALARLPSGSTELTFVGDGDARERLVATASALGLGGAVSVTGWIRREQALSRVSESHVCLLPLRDNPLTRTTIGNKMFEYMGLARPILSSGVGVMARIVKETGAGAVVEPWTAESLAEALRPFLSDATPLIDMGRRGLQAVLESYNWDSEKRRLLTAYASLGLAP
jgi:glycosyltransferase involved in cell wall biosynthesis